MQELNGSRSRKVTEEDPRGVGIDAMYTKEKSRDRRINVSKRSMKQAMDANEVFQVETELKRR